MCHTVRVGEIWVRSPQVMQGYWNLPEATAEAVTADGWFKTGDAAYLDEDGYVYIHDRVKDMIVRRGERLPGRGRERPDGAPGHGRLAVIGVPDEKWGETAKAIVVRHADAGVTQLEIIGSARSVSPSSSARRASSGPRCAA